MEDVIMRYGNQNNIHSVAFKKKKNLLRFKLKSHARQH